MQCVTAIMPALLWTSWNFLPPIVRSGLCDRGKADRIRPFFMHFLAGLLTFLPAEFTHGIWNAGFQQTSGNENHEPNGSSAWLTAESCRSQTSIFPPASVPRRKSRSSRQEIKDRWENRLMYEELCIFFWKRVRIDCYGFAALLDPSSPFITLPEAGVKRRYT